MIEILRIVGAFGIRGAVRVVSYSQDLSMYKALYSKSGEEFSFRVLKAGVIALTGISDRNTAEALVGESLFVSEADLPPLAEGEFYLWKLVGFNIPVSETELMCEITNVYNYGAGDLIELKYDNRSFLVPFTKQNFPEFQGNLSISQDAFNNFR